MFVVIRIKLGITSPMARRTSVKSLLPTAIVVIAPHRIINTLPIKRPDKVAPIAAFADFA